VLELANSNELQSLGFMCCSHDEACYLSSRRGLFFAPLVSQFKIHVFLKVATYMFVSMAFLSS
jgi:hypothetical protein